MKKNQILLFIVLTLLQYANGNYIYQPDSAYTPSVEIFANDSSKLKLSLSGDIIISDSVLEPGNNLYKNLPDSMSFVRDSIVGRTDTFAIALVGDVMLGTDYPSPQYLPPGNNCFALLDPVKHLLQNADLTFCNLEGVFAGENGSPKTCKDPKTCYVFRMPEGYVNCLTEAGIDVVSVANNHVNDFGYAGRVNAAKILKEAGLHFAGFIDYPYTIFYIDSIRIGFCAFSTNSGVMDMRNSSEAASLVRFLADSCDIVLVSMHGGGEGSDFQHVTRKSETFLGADRGNVYAFAHRMIDAGADLVIGHGPHVTRAMEIYNGRFIAYSLGNFCTYSRFNLDGPNGIAPLVKINVTNEGKFISGNITSIKQTGEGGSQIDEDKKVIFKLQNLQQNDFPDEPLIIDNDGTIVYDAKDAELH
jgi:hypothetical protein